LVGVAALSIGFTAVPSSVPFIDEDACVASFVLAHGSWLGGWCWTRVADRLRRDGHDAFTPSFTGLGDRAHLLNSTITIDTFIDDLICVIESEELSDVVLVGHSFGGIPISGVADQVPERIAHLIYLDAAVVDKGMHAFAVYPPAEAEARTRAAEAATDGLAVPVPASPLPEAWGLGNEGDPDYDWVLRRVTPHPLRTYTTPLRLGCDVGNALPRTYVTCTRPPHPALERSRELVRSWSGWQWVELAAPHCCMITHPGAVAELLLQST
jgi:pimeloyl-ACP methyl ester carboxylesterase